MSAKYLTPDQIKDKLKLADELRQAGKPIHEVSRVLGITDSTLYNWRKRYLGGREDKDAQIAALRDENRRLRRHRGKDLLVGRVVKHQRAAVRAFRHGKVRDSYRNQPVFVKTFGLVGDSCELDFLFSALGTNPGKRPACRKAKAIELRFRHL